MAEAEIAPVFENIADFVQRLGGTRPISKILIANNGIGAVKAIRSIRRWAFEVLADENAVQFVVMATPEDLRANAEYIRMASEVVDVPGGSNNNNYANVSLIIEIAELRGVDAVWAGWGHASENPTLPEGLAATKRQIKFIGPAGAPMRALGDKIGSTIIAQSAGVPCISWNGDAVKIEFDTSGGKIVEVPDEQMRLGSVESAEACEEACERIGYPVMIKASEGGGGKGIRKCTSRSEIKEAYRQVQGELPGSPIFVMRLAPKSRHLEVQLLADEYGTAIALNGRDCSIQRRHQKIIEEGPPLAAPPDVWEEMEKAAINLAMAVGYANAGTVEYLFTEDGRFYFLELNPRLQVEHPVTEMINRVNLPAMQLMVAMGIPMARIPDVRKLYNRTLYSDDPINFETEQRRGAQSHCIAVRITAENPDVGFQPTSGGIHELNFRSTPDVWGYFSVDSSGLVHEFADSQFGHLFAQGSDREAARKSMIIALNELSIRGDIRTTVEYVEDLMRSEDFVANRIDTQWLDTRLADDRERREVGLVEKTDDEATTRSVAVAHAALIQAYIERRDCLEEFVETVGKGHTPDCGELLSTRTDVTLILEDVKFDLRVEQTGPESFLLISAGEKYVEGSVRGLADGGFLVSIGGRSRVAYTSQPPGGALRLILDRKTTLFSVEYDPSTLRAESAGKLAKKLVPDGAHVEVGASYAELEVMKMFLPLRVGADGSGLLRWAKSEGVALEAGEIVATVELDDPSSVRKAVPFDGDLAAEVGNAHDQDKSHRLGREAPHVRLRSAMVTLRNVLGGFGCPGDKFANAMLDFELALNDERLPLCEIDEAKAVLRGRLSPKLQATLEDATSSVEKFSAASILKAMDAEEASMEDDSAKTSFRTAVAQLRCVASAFAGGEQSKLVSSTLELLRLFLGVEAEFGSGAPFAEVVARLRKAAANSPEQLAKLAETCRARCCTGGFLLEEVEEAKTTKKAARSTLIISLLALCRRRLSRVDSALVPTLTELASLRDPGSTTVALQAQRLLVEQSAPSRSETLETVHSTLKALATKQGSDREAAITAFVRRGLPMRDSILYLLSCDRPSEIRAAALETYLAVIYETHSVSNFATIADCGLAASSWTFHSDLLNMDLILSGSTTDHPRMGMARSNNSGASLNMSTSSTSHLSSLDSFSSNLSMTPTKELSEVDLAGMTPPSSRLRDEQDAKNRRLHKSSALMMPEVTRFGLFAVFKNLKDADASLDDLLQRFPTDGEDRVNVLHVACVEDRQSQDDFVLFATSSLRRRLDALKKANVRRVTFITGREKKETTSRPRQYSFGEDPFSEAGLAETAAGVPAVYTFRAKNDFAEDVLFRHIEAPQAYHLDLVRLRNFSIQLVETTQTLLSNVHCYEVLPKDLVGGSRASLRKLAQSEKRFFVRMLSLQPEFSAADAERMLIESLAALELKVGANWSPSTQLAPKNHVFINLVARGACVEAAALEEMVRSLVDRHDDKLKRLGVKELELKLVCKLVCGEENGSSAAAAVRIVATNPTGYVLKLATYVEVEREGKICFEALRQPQQEDEDEARQREEDYPLEGLETTEPYVVLSPLARQRAQAKTSSETLYCYDYLSLLEEALRERWCAARPGVPPPKRLLRAVELVVKKRSDNKKWVAGDSVELEESRRPAGMNDVGMVAWRLEMYTVEQPLGRTVILIANDITKSAGSFGTREDVVFGLASQLARSLKCPRLYLAANSGARIGLAASVRSRIRVAWKDDKKPDEGFDYLYLDGPDFERLSKVGAVRGRIVTDPSRLPQHRRNPGAVAVYEVTDVIGEERDLGVENLRGSGAIAGETARAYNSIVTLTLVVGRSVGIGAYLVRLGHRTIQKRAASPIILTGYQALNKLLGRNVYTSNEQLGGPEIMHPNGVSHAVADDDYDVVQKALNWLSYVPAKRNEPPLLLNGAPYAVLDDALLGERDVEWAPAPSTPYDPRHLLAGASGNDGSFLSGFFDRGSFSEALGGWAKTVVVGRARLGGIACGCIVTENRTASAEKPADPADPSSREHVIPQAGGVWFPDSAHKTAQAIADFDAEDLPLFIFANWRGFSGGQRDMFDEVLKFGAQIVDRLVSFTKPVFVYIPPLAELRGGAWVVVDPTINEEAMEMYAAKDSRGGVLEPAGLVEIKFRSAELVLAMHRLDSKMIALDADLLAAQDGEVGSLTELEARQLIEARERELMPVYTSFAIHFADLHDTPGRMEAKGVIRKVVTWRTSRRFFYHRLKRRLAEFYIRHQLCEAHSVVVASAPYTTTALTASAASLQLKAAFSDDATWDSTEEAGDKSVLAWLQGTKATETVAEFRRGAIRDAATALARTSPSDFVKGLAIAAKDLQKPQRDALKAAILEALE